MVASRPPLIWTEEQELLRDSARGFLDEHAPIAELRRLRDSYDADGFSRSAWRDMAELGWPGIPFDESYGGAGLGIAELGVVLLECGRTLAATPLIASVALGGSLVALAGDEAHRQSVLVPLCKGELLLAAAVQEGPQHAPYRVATRATKTATGWSLSGSKHFVLDAHCADRIVVVARTAGSSEERDGLGLFLVDAFAFGLRIDRTRMIDGRNAANLQLDSVEVPADALLGSADGAADALDLALARATTVLAAEMLGGIEVAFEKTLAYLKVRKQFGAPLGSFQALKHRAAKMFIEIELSKTAVLEALFALDAGDPEAQRLASATKAKLSETAFQVGNEGVQMHGGIGVTDEEDIGLFMKRFRVQQRTFGDAAFHRDRFAALSGY